MPMTDTHRCTYTKWLDGKVWRCPAPPRPSSHRCREHQSVPSEDQRPSMGHHKHKRTPQPQREAARRLVEEYTTRTTGSATLAQTARVTITNKGERKVRNE